ncbi:hypothetical protein GCM10009613_32110 [Pseudonocardia kongjuensis]|uniref:4Fe-4S ferredoxin-type domain-containing protein n=1 Tax=Pseudonocardia kongjuensis TaxID=102227 RepID=A0ABP4ILY9_9PSEU
MIPVVHPEFCAGSGACARAAPTVFGLDDRGWVELLDSHPGPERAAALLEARDACPLAAIEVLDEHGDPVG